MTGVEIETVAEDGRPSATGEPRESRLLGDGVMNGYWQGPGATAAAFDENWLCARDIGLIDNLGIYWILDRHADLILRGGENIYPAEVETVIRQLPEIGNAAVVGGRSKTWGQTPGAFVGLTPGRIWRRRGSHDGASRGWPAISSHRKFMSLIKSQ